MKLKKRKKYIWCHVSKVHVTEFYIDNYKNKYGYMKRTKIGKLKCPDCGKKFNPKIETCGDIINGGKCWHVFLPAHKKVIKV